MFVSKAIYSFRLKTNERFYVILKHMLLENKSNMADVMSVALR